MSKTLTLYSRSSTFQQTYFPPILLNDGNWQIAMIDFHTYNSIPNITAYNNQIKIGEHLITIPIGAYQINEINQAINDILKSLEQSDIELINIRGNNSTLKCEIKSTLTVDLNVENSIAPLLGFAKTVLEPGKIHISQYPVDIINVSDIRIECNLATDSFVNGAPTRTIYGFFPDVPVGHKINIRPSSLIYYPVNTDIVDVISIRIIDQSGRPVDFSGELLTLRIHLKRI